MESEEKTLLIDLHVQSRFSSGGVFDPEEVILRARTAGLDGVCFTEDQPLPSWREVKGLGERHQMTVLIGAKVTTDVGRYLVFVPNAADLEPGGILQERGEVASPLPIRVLVRKVKQRGGVLVAAHPYLRTISLRSGDRIFLVEGLDAVEVRHAACASVYNDMALIASAMLNLPGVGGSGTREDLQKLGKAATLFRTPIQSEADLIEAIRSRQLWPVEFLDQVPVRSEASGVEMRREYREDPRREGPPRDDFRRGDRPERPERGDREDRPSRPSFGGSRSSEGGLDRRPGGEDRGFERRSGGDDRRGGRDGDRRGGMDRDRRGGGDRGRRPRDR